VRLRDCVPEAQLTVHVLHEVQLDTVQSLGHECVLQLTTLDAAPQLAPPKPGWVSERLWIIIPLPHDLVHNALVHGPAMQSTGQGAELQVRIAFFKPHSTPPHDVETILVRRRCCTPVPQDSEHECQLDHAES
jgi:hypothetical protein